MSTETPNPTSDEPSSEGGEPVVQTDESLPPDTRTTEEIQAENEAKVAAAQAYKTDPRNAIYAKRTQILAAEQGENDAMLEEGRAAGTGLQTPPETPPEPAAAAPVAPAGKTVKLVVYGQEREVPESEVIQAGVATLQKDAAADQKLSVIAQREQALRTQEASLLQAADRIRNGLDPATGLPLRNAGQPPATGAEPPAISKDQLESTVKALYSGDPDAAAQALGTLVTQITSRASTTSPVPPNIVETVERAVLERIDHRSKGERDAAERAEANTVFKTEFADVAADADKMAAARGITSTLLADPTWSSKGAVAIARETGARLRRMTTPTPPAPEREVINARRETKRGLTPQPQGGARAPAPPVQQFPSNKSYIQQLRKNSGSNSAR